MGIVPILKRRTEANRTAAVGLPCADQSYTSENSTRERERAQSTSIQHPILSTANPIHKNLIERAAVEIASAIPVLVVIESIAYTIATGTVLVHVQSIAYIDYNNNNNDNKVIE